MTLPEYFRIMRYWSRQPPVHILKGHQMGIKPPKTKWQKNAVHSPENQASLAMLFAMAKDGKLRV